MYGENGREDKERGAGRESLYPVGLRQKPSFLLWRVSDLFRGCVILGAGVLFFVLSGRTFFVLPGIFSLILSMRSGEVSLLEWLGLLFRFFFLEIRRYRRTAAGPGGGEEGRKKPAPGGKETG